MDTITPVVFDSLSCHVFVVTKKPRPLPKVPLLDLIRTTGLIFLKDWKVVLGTSGLMWNIWKCGCLREPLPWPCACKAKVARPLKDTSLVSNDHGQIPLCSSRPCVSLISGLDHYTGLTHLQCDCHFVCLKSCTHTHTCSCTNVAAWRFSCGRWPVSTFSSGETFRLFIFNACSDTVIENHCPPPHLTSLPHRCLLLHTVKNGVYV